MAMPKALPEHRCYDWSDGKHRSIEIRLAVRRDEIAAILQIDPAETQAVCINDTTHAAGRSVAAYIAQRTSWSRVEFVPRIDLVLDDIKGILTRFMVDVSNLNERASQNVVRKTLEAIATRSDITEEEIELLDLSVREQLAEHYPGGRKNFRPGVVWPDFVIEAAQSALGAMEKPKRGRPKGSTNQAAEIFARELVAVFSANSPVKPSRSVINRKVQGEIVSREEGGLCLRFFECVREALPDEYRDKVTKSGGGRASLIQRALSVDT